MLPIYARKRQGLGVSVLVALWTRLQGVATSLEEKSNHGIRLGISSSKIIFDVKMDGRRKMIPPLSCSVRRCTPFLRRCCWLQNMTHEHHLTKIQRSEMQCKSSSKWRWAISLSLMSYISTAHSISAKYLLWFRDAVRSVVSMDWITLRGRRW